MSSHAERLAAFAAALRDPAKPVPPDLPPARLRTYRSLALNNLERLFGSSFPLCAELLGAPAWRALVEAFYRDWRASTWSIPELPAELVAWLRASPLPDSPPWLAELAEFEWLALEVRQDLRELPEQGPLSATDLDACPVLNPLLRLRRFEYPVHEFTKEQQPVATGEPVYLVACRGRDDEPRYMVVNAVTARLLELLVRMPGMSGREVLGRIAGELGVGSADGVMEAGRGMLGRLEGEGMVLGGDRQV